MIAALASALALAAGADPCPPVESTAPQDPAAAAVYRMVGEAELAAGSRGTAAIAFRSALALDRSDGASRLALQALCREGPGASGRDPFAAGLARMDGGDPEGAIAAFREARAAAPDPSAALLEGICHYQLGEDAEAGPLLREAEAAAAHRDAARFYLGLIALRRGEGSEAAGLFDEVAASPGFGPLAYDLARYARREGRVVISVLAESGWDSNASLASGTSFMSSASDGLWNITATGLYRPSGESGPYLRASGVYRQQFQLDALDLGGLSGAAGWQLGRASQALLAEYDYDYRRLDGSPYLAAHRILVSGWTTSGDLTLSATYFARFESYLSSSYADFTGIWQRAEARASWGLGPAARVGVAYRLGGDGVRQAQLSWIEHGPRADFRARLGRRFRLGLEAAVSFRPYGAMDLLFGAKRSDTYLDGAALAEYDLGDRWTARLSLDARKAFSNVSVLEYLKVVPTFGIAYVMVR